MLIKCPDCSQEISNDAVACPHCGCPNQQREAPVTTEFHMAGIGCYVQLIGTLAFVAWVRWTNDILTAIPWIILGGLGWLGSIAIGRRMAWRHWCSKCRNPVKPESAICPNCQCHMVGQVLDDTNIIMSRIILVVLLAAELILIWRLTNMYSDPVQDWRFSL